MSEVRISLRQQIENYKNGLYNSPDFKTQCDAGWYDWFCKDSSLKGKTDKLYPKVMSIIKNDAMKKIDIDKVYVFFKNNCPVSHPLYDSFSICDIETGDVLFWCSPKYTYTNTAQLYDAKNGFNIPTVDGSWRDVINYFKS